jgi:shikimate kinase|tara:strand:- start:2007 stop:2519 length:513 start_codon:yes stop_codon:yes gene_type:complete
MHSKKSLVFLGMMGSGKSSIGFLVSKKLNLKFVDIDNIIEDETGMKISNIFEEKGEDYFRNLEEKITLKVLKISNIVVSLGGGGFINDKIRNQVLSNHFSFWLNWDSEILLTRIKNSNKRPLVHKSTNQEIINLIKKRAKIYSKAKFKINCNKLTKNEIVKKITKIYELN